MKDADTHRAALKLTQINAPGAAFADLFRAHELKSGGVYVDMDCAPRQAVSTWVGNEDAVFYIEHRAWLVHWCWFVRENHPVVVELCRRVVSNIDGIDAWKPGSTFIFETTGPAVLDAVARDLLPKRARFNGQWVAGTYALGGGRSVTLRYASILPWLPIQPAGRFEGGVDFARMPVVFKYFGAARDQNEISSHYMDWDAGADSQSCHDTKTLNANT